MSWLVLATTFICICSLCVLLLLSLLYKKVRKVVPSSTVIAEIIITLVSWFIAYFSFGKYIQKVQSDAIDYYIMGEVELVEKVVDNEVVDWWYIVRPEDHD